MSQLTPTKLLDVARAYLDRADLVDAVGGPEALEEGLRELAAGAMPLVGELAAAEAAGVDLSDAVHDADRFPHLVRFHGFLSDVLVMDLPEELVPWAREFVGNGTPSAGASALRRGAAAVALSGSEAMAHLARLGLFEALCLNQRLLLMSEGAHLEAVGGRARDIEAIAEREVDLAMTWRSYGRDLLGMDDPLPTLVAAAVVGLGEHVDHLRRELRTLRVEVHDNLDQRRRVLEVMDQLPPDQAVLVENECAAMLGEEKLEAEQLKEHHPGLLGGISRDAIYKRVHRLPGRIERLSARPVVRRSRSSLADLILGASREAS